MLKGKLIGGYVKDLLCSHYLFSYHLKYIRKSESFEAVSRKIISHLSHFIFSKFCFFKIYLHSDKIDIRFERC